MGDRPVLKAREVVAILERLGFTQVRQSGSHKQFRNAAGRVTTVSFHPGKDVPSTMVRTIARDIGISLDEFLRYR